MEENIWDREYAQREEARERALQVELAQAHRDREIAERLTVDDRPPALVKACLAYQEETFRMFSSAKLTEQNRERQQARAIVESEAAALQLEGERQAKAQAEAIRADYRAQASRLLQQFDAKNPPPARRVHPMDAARAEPSGR